MIAKQFALLFVSIATLYGAAIALSFVFVPAPHQSGGLDTGRAAETLFTTEPKYAFLNRAALRSEQPKVILLGASNVVVGFPQPQLQPLVTGATVHNLAISGSNITQVRQMLDLIQAVQTDLAQRRTVYAVGVWYGNFVTDRARWNTPDRVAGDTDLDIERYRYGFYRRTEHGPVALLPPSQLELGVELIHPYLALDQLTRRGTEWVTRRFFGRAPVRTDADRDATVLTEAERVKDLAYWHDQIKTDASLSDEQFDVLRQMSERILASGAKLLLVSLALPHWHAAASPYMASYRAKLASVLESLRTDPCFRYLDMQGADADLDYSDEVHPKPRVTGEWVHTLAAALEPVVRDLQPKSETTLADAATTTPR